MFNKITLSNKQVESLTEAIDKGFEKLINTMYSADKEEVEKIENSDYYVTEKSIKDVIHNLKLRLPDLEIESIGNLQYIISWLGKSYKLQAPSYFETLEILQNTAIDKISRRLLENHLFFYEEGKAIRILPNYWDQDTVLSDDILYVTKRLCGIE